MNESNPVLPGWLRGQSMQGKNYQILEKLAESNINDLVELRPPWMVAGSARRSASKRAMATWTAWARRRSMRNRNSTAASNWPVRNSTYKRYSEQSCDIMSDTILTSAISSRVPVFEFCAVSRVNLLFYFEGQTGPF